MKGNLYLIKNRVNDKVYVGKTYASLNRRFAEHIHDSKRYPNRPLYKAINSLGSHQFYIELMGTYEEEILEIKEQELIEKLKSYINGYNATLGGDGRRNCKVSNSDIISTYNGNAAETSRILGIDVATVLKVVKPIATTPFRHKEIVYCEQLDLQFNSITECAQYLIDSNIAKSKDVEIVRRSLSRHLNGNRKSYLRLIFKKGINND